MNRALACVLAATLLAGCTKDPSSPRPTPGTIELTGAQAATVTSRIELAVTSNADLAWLADSVQLVITSGATAKRIAVTTDFDVDEYFAVSLQRKRSAGANSFSTFHLIGFDDPTNPTHFVVISGYASDADASPPLLASGTFDAPGTSVSVNGYLIGLENSMVRTWRATAGSASLATGGGSAGACVGFPATDGVTCAEGEIQVSFSITETHEENADFGEARTASLVSVAVPGIVLTFE